MGKVSIAEKYANKEADAREKLRQIIDDNIKKSEEIYKWAKETGKLQPGLDANKGLYKAIDKECDDAMRCVISEFLSWKEEELIKDILMSDHTDDDWLWLEETTRAWLEKAPPETKARFRESGAEKRVHAFYAGIKYDFLDSGLPVEPNRGEEASEAMVEYRRAQIQQKIDEIHKGNIAAIIEGVSSNNDLIVINAILSGAKLGVRDTSFIEAINKARLSETVVMGYPMKSVAEAAYHVLTDSKYYGEDNLVKTLLANKFELHMHEKK